MKALFIKLKAWFKKLFHKPTKYKVTACSHMPSLVGMITTSPIKVNTDLIFLGGKKQYRTIKAIKIINRKDSIEIYTPYLFFTITPLD